MSIDRTNALEERTRYEPGEVEPRVWARWEDAGIFHADAGGDPAENYSIAVPPPNVTGALHMGHALNGTIQDVLIRVNRMRGRRTKWIFGTDHAGIATQVKVEQQLHEEGLTRQEIGRAAFTERVWKWREEYGSTIVEQFKRLGASADYADERFTMDAAYAKAVTHVFVRLFERGLVYRDNYMVNWDPGTRSAISDLEVEQRPMEDTLYFVDYPLESSSGSITVATVRPETMLGDSAVAVHPDDERYTRLIGETAILPLTGRRLKIIGDPYVRPEFGTGALKITPAHDQNDFEIGRKHGLDEISVIGEDGRMTEAAGPYAGMEVEEARTAVVAALRAEGLISGTQPYQHEVPHSHRSGRRIEPLISLQWFCDVKRLAEPAIDCVKDGRVRFHPARPHTQVYLDWLENIRPWCISRQLWWGHQIPVWYCSDCEETFVGETAPERCGVCGGELVRDPDVLDTWFSSALWPFATLGWPADTDALRAFYPTDALVTARDIIFLWVARMVMMGLEFTGEPPFGDVQITSVVQAPDGRRMSKSLGTGIDPLEEIDAYGADAVRFGLLAMASSQDVRYSAEKVRQGQRLANKLWNASRFVLLGVEEGAEPAIRPETVEDRWIVSRLERATARAGELIDSYDFSHAALELYDVFYDEVCDWYIELAKPRLWEREGSRAAVSSTLLWALERSLVLLHAIMPFVTEEIWSYMPGAEARGALAGGPWPTPAPELIDPGAEAAVGTVIAAVTALRSYRARAGIPDGTRLPAALAAEGYGETAAHVGRLARFEWVSNGAGSREPTASVPVPGGAVHLFEGSGASAEEATRRLAARLAALEAEASRAEAKLANPKFVERAPAEVVAAEREKLERAQRELRELRAQ